MQIRILIVDDDRDLLVLIDRFLNREYPEFQTSLAVSAQDALRRLESERFDAVVCDYHLGPNEMNGLELLEWLRESGVNVPFIMFTGRSREEVAIRALNLGADFYLKKDIEDFDNLFRELAHHLQGAVESREIEDALIESESKFRAIFQRANVGIVRASIRGTILEMNDSLSYMLEQAPKDSEATSIFDLVDSNERETILKLWTELQQGIRDSFQVETRLSGNTRTVIWGRMSVSVVLNVRGEPTFAIVMIEDITNLKDSEENYRALVDNINCGIVIVKQGEKPISYTNPEATSILGVSKEILSDSGLEEMLQMIHPEDRAFTARMFKDVFRDVRRIEDLEIRVIRKDGSHRWVTISANSLVYDDEPAYLVTFVDITKQKEVEIKYQNLFEGAAQAIMVTDYETPTIYDYNEQMCMMLGYNTEEFKHLSVVDIAAGETENEIISRLSQIIDVGTSVFETKYIRNDGEVINVEVKAKVVEIGERKIIQSCINDVTDRHMMEQRIKSERDMAQLYLDLADVLFLVLDLNGKISLLNKKGEQILGVSSEDALGKSWFDNFIPEENRTSITGVFDNIISNYDAHEYHDNYVLCSDGSQRLIRWHNTILRNNDGDVIGTVSSGIDITEQEEARILLEESEERYKTLIDSAPVGIAVHQSGKLVFANQAAADIIGDDSSADLLGINVFEIVHPDSREEVIQRVQDVYDGKEVELLSEQTWLKLDGSPIDVEVTASTIMYQGEVASQVIFRDITEKKIAEKTLKETEERFRSFTEHFPGSMFIRDTQGYHVYVNKHVRDNFNYGCSDWVGKHLDEVLPPDISSIFKKQDKEVLGKGTMEYIDEIEAPSGEIRQHRTIKFPIAQTDGSFLLGGISFDVTDLLETTEKLMQSEEKYRSVVEGIFEGIVLFSPIDQKILFTNSAMIEMIGRTLEGMTFRETLDIIHPDDQEKLVELNMRRLKGDDVPNQYRFRFLKGDGEIGWLEVAVSHTYFDEKPAFLASFLEVTERAKIELALRESEEQFRSFAENFPGFLFIKNERSEMVFVNDTLKEVHPKITNWDGIRAKDYLPKNVADLFEEQDQLVLEDGPLEFDDEIPHVDGRTRYHHTVKFPIEKGNGQTHIGAISIDVTDYTIAQRHLSDSEERFRALAEGSFQGIIVLNSESLEIEYSNQTLSEIIGYSKEELKLFSVSELLEIIHPDDREMVRDRLTRLIAGESGLPRYDFRITRKDGSEAILEISVTRIFLKERTMILSTVVDITERAIAEKALLEREREFRTLVSNLTSAVYRCEIDEYWTMLYLSNPILDITGYNRSDFINNKIRSFLSVMHPDDREEVRRTILEAVDRNLPYRIEYRILHSDGSIRWVEEQGQAILNEENEYYLSGVIQEITERKENEERIKESEERYRTVVQSIEDIILVIDAENRYSEFLSGNINLILGKPPDFIGKKPSEIFDNHLSSKIEKAVEEVRATGNQRTLEYPLLIDGNEYWFSSSLTLHEDKSSVVAVIRDITHSVEITQDLIKQREELSEFAHSMSHDINNYILKLRMLNQIIETDFDADSINKSNIILHEISELIRHSVLLADSGLAVVKNEEVDIRNLLRTVSGNFIPEEIEFENSCSIRVLGDSLKLTQVFSNLIQNAVLHGKPRNISAFCNRMKNHIILTIQNDGIPIPEDIRSQLFIEGYSRQKGTRGFGLRIVMKIVRAHGWDVSLGDEQKTSFKIMIPIEDIVE